MKRVVVTGAQGFLGRAVVAAASSSGYVVRAVSRDAREAPSSAVDWLALGDFSQNTDWTSAVADADCVIHCAARAHVLREEAEDPLAVFRAINRDAAFSLAQAATRAGVGRFVFVSSIGVNGSETWGQPFRAEDVPAPRSPYAVSKHEAEGAIFALGAKTGLEVVVVRPPLVIGPRAKGNLGMISSLVRRGLPLPFRAIRNNRRDLVSLDVLADLLVRCIGASGAVGKVLLAGDGFARSTAQIVRAVAAAEGLEARLVSVPPLLIDTALRLAGRDAMRSQLLGDLEVDIGPTCEALGWQPSPSY